SYSQIVRQIETLQRKANAARKKEVAGVVGRIKEAISFYHLTADELGLSLAKSVASPARSAAAPSSTAHAAASKRRKGAPKSKSKFGDAAKYRDASGNEWVGRGPRPIWLRQALAGGQSLSDFAIGKELQGGAAKKPSRKAKSRRAKKAPVAKYKDAASNKTWSGRGRKPGWFVSALAEGKPLESMAV
nr:H-NS histone family protein [Pseudomonadota bacterium]